MSERELFFAVGLLALLGVFRPTLEERQAEIYKRVMSYPFPPSNSHGDFERVGLPTTRTFISVGEPFPADAVRVDSTPRLYTDAELGTLTRFRLYQARVRISRDRRGQPARIFHDLESSVPMKASKYDDEGERRKLDERVRQQEVLNRGLFDQQTQHLPTHKREALWLVHRGGSYAEAEALSGIPSGTLRVAYHRIRPLVPALD